MSEKKGREKMGKIIQINNLYKEYRSKSCTVSVLKDINLEIERGEIAVLLGRSGSGKTTLLNVIGGLLTPDKGNVLIDGQELYGGTKDLFGLGLGGISESRRAEIRNKKIGYIYQDINLINELNVLENIRLPFDIAGRRYDIEYENKIIDMLRLRDRLRFYPAQLSGGERQRTAIARAMVKKPSIILADEPNGNLDSRTGRELMEFIKEFGREQSQTFLVVTHDKTWLEYADKVYEISDGEVLPYVS
ncbi:MAG: ABC transporter ATP-binding protein [Parasporobacterium sp.]|nr:ABC transporter ATP-binding protein [Parasporobacterium sp.]